MHKQEFRGRPLQVKVSVPASVKRSATVITSKARSQSAEPNGVTGKSPDVEMQKVEDDRSARTLGLMNIPDTVNDSRIRAIAEPFGPLVKIILRPDREGAIVEFVDVKAAGKASLELERHEIAPGRRIRVGTASDVLRKAGPLGIGGGGNGGGAKSKTTSGPLMPQVGAPVKRPTQPGVRGVGRRGGLGFKRGGSAAPDRSDAQQTAPTTEGGATEQKPQKSNDDFRAMIQSNGK